MRLFRLELSKVIGNRMFWLAFLGAAALNIFLCIWSSDQEIIDAGEYRNLYTDMGTLNSNDEVRDYLQKKRTEIPDDNYRMNQLYYKASEQLEKVVTYEAYLEGIGNRAAKITKVSIFAQKDSFTYRSILRTPHAYEHLKGNQLTFGNSQTIIFATNREFTDVLAFLLIFMVITILILSEKEKGLFALLRPTKKGRVQLLFAKVLAIYTCCVFLFFLLYLGNYCASLFIYGKCDLSSLIQSIEGFMGSILEVTVGGYLIIFTITKIASYFLIASFLVFLCILARTGLFVYVTASVYSVVSAQLYILINSNSYLSFFKYINPVSLIHTNKLYENYLDLNFFGHPVNFLRISIFLLIFGNILLLLINLVVFSRQKNLIFHNSKLIQWLINRFNVKKKVSSKLWTYEAYKILIANKAILIMIAMVILGWNNYRTYRMPYIMYDSIYKYYVTQAQGHIGPETYQYIENEKARFQYIRDELEVLAQEFKNGKMSVYVYENLSYSYKNELAREIGFSLLQDKVWELEPYYEEDGTIKPWLLYDTGYNQLFGVMDNKSLNMAHLFFLIGMLAGIAPIYAAENTFGAKRLLMTTPKGRQQSFFIRMGIGAFITLGLFTAAYLPGLLNILQNYGSGEIGAPIQSITRYHDLPLPISIGGFLCLLYGIRLLSAMLMMMIILCISYHSKSITSALTLASGVFVIPYVILLLGSSFLNTILWNPNIIVCDYFMKAPNITDKLLLIMNLIVTLFISILVIRKTYRKIKYTL